MKRREPEPQTREGICCGCQQSPMQLFPVSSDRWRCDACFLRETGHRHPLAPRRYFASDPHQPKDRIGGMDERCANCRNAFNDHYNGRCPPDEVP